jgi:hypothetical protein
VNQHFIGYFVITYMVRTSISMDIFITYMVRKTRKVRTSISLDIFCYSIYGEENRSGKNQHLIGYFVIPIW